MNSYEKECIKNGWVRNYSLDRKYNLRFRYYKKETDTGGYFAKRFTKGWYLPIEKFGEIVQRFIRKHITCD